MLKTAEITFNNHTCLVSGELDFSNVMSVYAKSVPQLEASPKLEFDFSQVKSSDSAGLALMIEWIKFAARRNKPIHFSHVSRDMMSIAKASGLDNLINKMDG